MFIGNTSRDIETMGHSSIVIDVVRGVITPLLVKISFSTSISCSRLEALACSRYFEVQKN
jgi:hypothetical protein